MQLNTELKNKELRTKRKYGRRESNKMDILMNGREDKERWLKGEWYCLFIIECHTNLLGIFNATSIFF